MTWNGNTNWILVNHTATSLHSMITNGNFIQTNVGREEWMSLINGVKLQPHCNKEVFNVKLSQHKMLRIGIAGNNEKNCDTCDSAIGFGIKLQDIKLSSGNMQLHPQPQKIIETFGYIFVQ